MNIRRVQPIHIMLPIKSLTNSTLETAGEAAQVAVRTVKATENFARTYLVLECTGEFSGIAPLCFTPELAETIKKKEVLFSAKIVKYGSSSALGVAIAKKRFFS